MATQLDRFCADIDLAVGINVVTAVGNPFSGTKIRALAEGIADWYRAGSTTGLDSYSDTCLRRIWRAEHFSWWMTTMLHRIPGGDPFDAKLQLSQLAYVASSRAAATSLAENYVGFDVATPG